MKRELCAETRTSTHPSDREKPVENLSTDTIAKKRGRKKKSSSRASRLTQWKASHPPILKSGCGLAPGTTFLSFDKIDSTKLTPDHHPFPRSPPINTEHTKTFTIDKTQLNENEVMDQNSSSWNLGRHLRASKRLERRMCAMDFINTYMTSSNQSTVSQFDDLGRKSIQMLSPDGCLSVVNGEPFLLTSDVADNPGHLEVEISGDSSTKIVIPCRKDSCGLPLFDKLTDDEDGMDLANIKSITIKSDHVVIERGDQLVKFGRERKVSSPKHEKIVGDESERANEKLVECEILCNSSFPGSQSKCDVISISTSPGVHSFSHHSQTSADTLPSVMKRIYDIIHLKQEPTPISAPGRCALGEAEAGQSCGAHTVELERKNKTVKCRKGSRQSVEGELPTPLTEALSEPGSPKENTSYLVTRSSRKSVDSHLTRRRMTIVGSVPNVRMRRKKCQSSSLLNGRQPTDPSTTANVPSDTLIIVDPTSEQNHQAKDLAKLSANEDGRSEQFKFCVQMNHSTDRTCTSDFDEGQIELLKTIQFVALSNKTNMPNHSTYLRQELQTLNQTFATSPDILIELHTHQPRLDPNSLATPSSSVVSNLEKSENKFTASLETGFDSPFHDKLVPSLHNDCTRWNDASLIAGKLSSLFPTVLSSNCAASKSRSSDSLPKMCHTSPAQTFTSECSKLDDEKVSCIPDCLTVNGCSQGQSAMAQAQTGVGISSIHPLDATLSIETLENPTAQGTGTLNCLMPPTKQASESSELNSRCEKYVSGTIDPTIDGQDRVTSRLNGFQEKVHFKRRKSKIESKIPPPLALCGRVSPSAASQDTLDHAELTDGCFTRPQLTPQSSALEDKAYNLSPGCSTAAHEGSELSSKTSHSDRAVTENCSLISTSSRTSILQLGGSSFEVQESDNHSAVIFPSHNTSKLNLSVVEREHHALSAHDEASSSCVTEADISKYQIGNSSSDFHELAIFKSNDSKPNQSLDEICPPTSRYTLPPVPKNLPDSAGWKVRCYPGPKEKRLSESSKDEPLLLESSDTNISPVDSVVELVGEPSTTRLPTHREQSFPERPGTPGLLNDCGTVSFEELSSQGESPHSSKVLLGDFAVTPKGVLSVEQLPDDPTDSGAIHSSQNDVLNDSSKGPCLNDCVTAPLEELTNDKEPDEKVLASNHITDDIPVLAETAKELSTNCTSNEGSMNPLDCDLHSDTNAIEIGLSSKQVEDSINEPQSLYHKDDNSALASRESREKQALNHPSKTGLVLDEFELTNDESVLDSDYTNLQDTSLSERPETPKSQITKPRSDLAVTTHVVTDQTCAISIYSVSDQSSSDSWDEFQLEPVIAKTVGLGKPQCATENSEAVYVVSDDSCDGWEPNEASTAVKSTHNNDQIWGEGVRQDRSGSRAEEGEVLSDYEVVADKGNVLLLIKKARLESESSEFSLRLSPDLEEGVSQESCRTSPSRCQEVSSTSTQQGQNDQRRSPFTVVGVNCHRNKEMQPDAGINQEGAVRQSNESRISLQAKTLDPGGETCDTMNSFHFVDFGKTLPAICDNLEDDPLYVTPTSKLGETEVSLNIDPNVSFTSAQDPLYVDCTHQPELTQDPLDVAQLLIDSSVQDPLDEAPTLKHRSTQSDPNDSTSLTPCLTEDPLYIDPRQSLRSTHYPSYAGSTFEDKPTQGAFHVATKLKRSSLKDSSNVTTIQKHLPLQDHLYVVPTPQRGLSQLPLAVAPTTVKNRPQNSLSATSTLKLSLTQGSVHVASTRQVKSTPGLRHIVPRQHRLNVTTTLKRIMPKHLNISTPKGRPKKDSLTGRPEKNPFNIAPTLKRQPEPKPLDVAPTLKHRRIQDSFNGVPTLERVPNQDLLDIDQHTPEWDPLDITPTQKLKPTEDHVDITSTWKYSAEQDPLNITSISNHRPTQVSFKYAPGTDPLDITSKLKHTATPHLPNIVPIRIYKSAQDPLEVAPRRKYSSEQDPLNVTITSNLDHTSQQDPLHVAPCSQLTSMHSLPNVNSTLKRKSHILPEHFNHSLIKKPNNTSVEVRPQRNDIPLIAEELIDVSPLVCGSPKMGDANDSFLPTFSIPEVKHSDERCSVTLQRGIGKSRYFKPSNLAVSKGITYFCKQCNFSTSSDHQLRIHVDLKHRGADPFHCSKCPFKCSSAGMLAQHRTNCLVHRDQSNEKELQMRQRLIKLSKPAKSSRPLESARAKLSNSVVTPKSHCCCTFCGRKYSSLRWLDSHVIKVHLSVKCPECSLVVQRQEFKEHVTAHGPDVGSIFLCSVCPFTSPIENVIEIHKIVVHQAVSSSVIFQSCPLCPSLGEKFSKFVGLKRHILQSHSFVFRCHSTD